MKGGPGIGGGRGLSGLGRIGAKIVGRFAAASGILAWGNAETKAATGLGFVYRFM